jgi:hypothetical protein
MGATSAQGWYLFTFIVGFTMTPAGLVYLGWPAALAGLALLGVSLAGFRRIRGPAATGRADAKRSPTSVGARAANSL